MVAEEEAEQEEGSIMNHNCRDVFRMLYDTAQSIESVPIGRLVAEAREWRENPRKEFDLKHPLWWATRAYREPDDSAEVWEAKQFLASRAKTLADEVKSRGGIHVPEPGLYEYAESAIKELSLELKERAFEGFIKCACPR